MDHKDPFIVNKTNDDTISESSDDDKKNTKVIEIINKPIGDNKQTTNTSDDKKHQLENLKDLLDQGIITSEEFEVKKKNILGL